MVPLPTLHSRVALLYLRGERWACRKCCRLAYQSELECKGRRGQWRAQKIQARLGGDRSGFEFPDKPRGTHWHTYERWREKHEGRLGLSQRSCDGVVIGGFLIPTVSRLTVANARMNTSAAAEMLRALIFDEMLIYVNVELRAVASNLVMQCARLRVGASPEPGFTFRATAFAMFARQRRKPCDARPTPCPATACRRSARHRQDLDACPWLYG
jgi:hypothetical protein